jgi:hypothetical protein
VAQSGVQEFDQAIRLAMSIEYHVVYGDVREHSTVTRGLPRSQSVMAADGDHSG